MIRFSGYTEHFKYSFVSSFYVHPKNFYIQDPDNPDADIFNPHFKQTDSIGGIAMLMAHRIEVRPTPRLNFALTEAIMYQNEDNYLDLRIFNPIMLYHNLYIKAYANSLLTFEFDVNILPGLDLYFQLAIDDLAVPFVENDPNVPGSKSPNSTGQMLGLRYVLPMDGGLFKFSTELTTTSPFLYLRNHAKGGVDGDKHYGLSFLTGVREYGSEEGSRYDLEYIGYQYGGDAIVFNVNAGYESYDRWKVGGSFFYMAHGTVDQYTRWQEYDTAASGPTTPTDKHPEGQGTSHSKKDEDGKVVADPEWATSKDAVEHTFVLEANGSYNITKGLDITSAIDLVTVIAPGNHSIAGTVCDLQFKLGLSYRY